MKRIGDVTRRGLVGCLAGSAVLPSVAATEIPEVMFSSEVPMGVMLYRRDGQWHRDGGRPAMIAFDSCTGAIGMEVWQENGKFHRERGPAYIVYDDDGTALEKGWWRAGVKVGTWKAAV